MYIIFAYIYVFTAIVMVEDYEDFKAMYMDKEKNL